MSWERLVVARIPTCSRWSSPHWSATHNAWNTPPADMQAHTAMLTHCTNVHTHFCFCGKPSKYLKKFQNIKILTLCMITYLHLTSLPPPIKINHCNSLLCSNMYFIIYSKAAKQKWFWINMIEITLFQASDTGQSQNFHRMMKIQKKLQLVLPTHNDMSPGSCQVPLKCCLHQCSWHRHLHRHFNKLHIDSTDIMKIVLK